MDNWDTFSVARDKRGQLGHRVGLRRSDVSYWRTKASSWKARSLWGRDVSAPYTGLYTPSEKMSQLKTPHPPNPLALNGLHRYGQPAKYSGQLASCSLLA